MNSFEHIGFVSVRTSSTRLPKKCLLPFGKDNVITHVVKRAINFQIEPIICTTTDSSDDILEELAKHLNVRLFRGSLNNKLKRWLDCADFFDIDSFHTIDADDLFFDGEQMKDSLNLLKKETYDCICPPKESSDGDGSVGYSLTREVIRKSLQNIDDETDTEMMWYFLQKVQNIKMLELKVSSSYNSPLRLTLDFEEDYWLLSFLQRILGSYATRDEINNLFISNPDLAELNLFRNHEWKAAQLSKKI